MKPPTIIGVLKNARQMLAKRNFYANYDARNYRATRSNCHVQTQTKVTLINFEVCTFN